MLFLLLLESSKLHCRQPLRWSWRPPAAMVSWLPLDAAKLAEEGISLPDVVILQHHYSCSDG
ncbi:hypothetical protein BBK36DRAFT_1181743, partial [Trichoderma citrinoviride]